MWTDTKPVLLWSAVALASSGCFSARGSDGHEDVLRAARTAAAAAPPSAGPASDDDLASETRLETVLARVLARSPDLLEAGERAQALAWRSRAASAWPDTELKVEAWGVPLDRPVAFGSADTVMVGLRQEIPPPGSLGASGRAALADAKVALETQKTRELDLILQTKHAFHDYVLASWEVKLHAEHLELSRGLVEATSAAYRANRASQQDVLGVELEALRQHTELTAAQQRLVSARALLNALMARPVDAPLGAPVGPTSADLDTTGLERARERPELRASALTIERARAAETATRRRASWPTFMVGADYWLMPTLDQPHAYGLMVSMTLPWLNPGKRAEVRAAEHEVRAAARATDAARIAVDYQAHDALARYEAARVTFATIEGRLLPQATRAYEASRAAFGTPQGNAVALLQAFRLYLDARLERARALARLATAAADLERAVGSDLPRRQP